MTPLTVQPATTDRHVPLVIWNVTSQKNGYIQNIFNCINIKNLQYIFLFFSSIGRLGGWVETPMGKFWLDFFLSLPFARVHKYFLQTVFRCEVSNRCCVPCLVKGVVLVDQRWSQATRTTSFHVLETHCIHTVLYCNLVCKT